ncbi:Adenylyltransferase and sulfurtransferase uba4 [Neonectria ditissima]|uniref:Adenylyltransferase and sulfurtransferase uba4 n=1 Tax=Neonectria ditissima TaxID=78410 RepID=A0A0N8H8S6_9HYPO|nr:Adenylyltransferase and sulfurtransferase uba4 [Neonectria ditissima]
MDLDRLDEILSARGTDKEKLDNLRIELERRKAELASDEEALDGLEHQVERPPADADPETWKWPLEPEEYDRYSRQMIVPGFGLQARVLVVGAGGLGCPAAAYLAGAGVGTLGLADGDTVEVSNLHRQVAHCTSRVGRAKVDSAITLNPTVKFNAHRTHLTPGNASSVVSGYDVVLDCTDHPTSRYLVSDACVLLGKPLVSASAFQTAGQLMVLNDPPGRGPCYRCVFPTPPPPDSVVGCGEGGILGPVVGAMGVMQALEAVKLIARGDDNLEPGAEPGPHRMLLFSGMADVPFRSVRMRGKRDGCFACGAEATLTLRELSTSMDYVQFCGVRTPVRILLPHERVSAKEYDGMSKMNHEEHVLLDVREKEQFDLCSIAGSINVPISRFMSTRGSATPEGFPADLPPSTHIFLVCRVGNDSQIAAQKLKELGFDNNGNRFIKDIKGGIKSWKDDVDPTMPFI